VPTVRAVVDTSAWVSAVLSRGGRAAQLVDAIRASRFTLVTSEQLAAETDEVLSRPKLIVSGAARAAARELLRIIRELGEFVSFPGEIRICRDPNDDRVIETAMAGKADVLVTGDKDLTDDPAVTEALSAKGTRVVSIAQFLDELERET
jgi:putative PIN family toxin of toxin-antitoxin system